ncbi:MAG: DMT family transporter [Planctomycetales bacterium]|nr:DMT family transporter [Planctomycetales bacterium]
MPYFAFLLICLMWGASFILMDRALVAVGPMTVGVARLLGGALVLAIYCLATRKWTKFRRGDWLHLAMVALLANAWPFVIQPYVMRQADEHAFFGLMVTFVPIVTILVSIPMLGRRPTPRQLVGVLGGLACAWLVVLDGNQRGISVSNLLLALSVPVTYAIGNTYIKWKLDHMPAAPMATAFLAIAGLMLLPLQFSPSALAALGMQGPATPHDWPLAIASLAVLGALSTGMAILLFIWLVKTQGPLFAGMVTYVVPMVALVWGQWDGERLTSLQIAAVAGVLAMVGLVQWGAARSPVLAKPATATLPPPHLTRDAPLDEEPYRDPDPIGQQAG